MDPQPAGGLSLSGTAEADAELAPLHQDRHPPVALGEFQHLRQGLLIFFDVSIGDGQSFFALGLPGPPGEGSVVFSEDGDLLGHFSPL
jgi:hypothetical protein